MGWLSFGASILGGILGKKQRKKEGKGLGIAKTQYDRWQRIYGPIEENVAEYYSGLRADSFTAQTISALESQIEFERESTLRQRNQQNLTGGAHSYLDERTNLSLAESKAKVRAEAPLKVAEAKNSFVTGSRINPGTPGLVNSYNDNRDYNDRRAKETSEGLGKLAGSIESSTGNFFDF